MNNYTGQLKGFPQEIIDKMCDYQVEQGNQRNPMVFDYYIKASKLSHGFGWYDTPEKGEFWNKVIGGDFDLFFQKYPLKSEYPKLMYVSDISKDDAFEYKRKRVVFMEKCSKYVAWLDARTIEESEKSTYANSWNFAVDIPIEQRNLVYLTFDDISTGKGIGIDPSLIVIKK